ncbi:MAG: hypothetical protein ACRDVG_05985, partial [Jatrophihabitantaceae bacterium]
MLRRDVLYGAMTTSPSEPDRSADDPFDGPEWTLSRSRTAAPAGDGDSAPEQASRPDRVRVRVNRRKRRRRRRAGWLLIAAGGLILAAAVWIVVTGLLARNQLAAARADVQKLRAAITSGDLTAARAAAADLAGHAHRAHVLTTGPAWAVAAALPGGGEPLRTMRGVTAA